MDIVRLYRDYSIPYVTDSHKHSREGWVNTPCPFCAGNFGYHLGFHIENEYFVCWRCGAHSKWKTFSTLLKVPIHKVNSILVNYDVSLLKREKAQDFVPIIKHLKLPTNISDKIYHGHKKYLIDRNFEPTKIQKQWDIKYTAMSSKIGNMNFNWRIFVPIVWNNQMVSYLGRAINPDNELRYLVCPEKYELQNIKTTIYGKPEKWGDMTILVEGVTDVWRLGDISTCVYGIKYTPNQVNIIAKSFKRVFVLFDEDKQAQKQSKILSSELNFRGVDAYSISMENDPASLSDTQAMELIKDLQTHKIK